MQRKVRDSRQVAMLEASRVIYRKLKIHPSVAYGVAKALDRQGLLASVTLGDLVNFITSGLEGLCIGEEKSGVSLPDAPYKRAGE